MGTGSQQIEQNYKQTNKYEAARGAPPDHPEGRGWGAETEGGLSTPGPIGEPFWGFGTAAENMALPLFWAHVPGWASSTFHEAWRSQECRSAVRRKKAGPRGGERGCLSPRPGSGNITDLNCTPNLVSQVPLEPENLFPFSA